MDEKAKRLFLKDHIKNESVIDELIVYSENKFINAARNSAHLDKAFIETWESYYKESKIIGAFETLKKYFVQLLYPMEKGISSTLEYRNSTLKGKPKITKDTLELNYPDHILLELPKNPLIGKVPVLVVPDNDDFTTIICALSNKNEPKELPNAMGALCINGINNWNRMHRLKTNWLIKNPLGNWNEEFKKNVLPNPYLFKDKLIVLSTKPYSGVKSEFVGLPNAIWKEYSLQIRQEHECAHLFTLQYYGCMANNIHDEIIADYAGITKVLGQFNKEWFLLFMGLEDYPNYKVGARLQNYQEPFTLSKEAFEGLKMIVKKVADSIFRFDAILGKITTTKDHLERIKSICEIDIITMASPVGVKKLLEVCHSKKQVTVE